MVTQCNRPRSELQASDQLQLEPLTQPGEHRWAVTRYDGVDHELVLIDQSELCQRQRQGHSSNGQASSRRLLELLNSGRQVTLYEFFVLIDPVQAAGHDVLLRVTDRSSERNLRLIHPFGP